MLQVFPENYVVWDLETTGFSPQGNRIVEVAAAIVQNNEIVESWSELIDFEGEMPEQAQNVHGISKEMCSDQGKPEREVLKRLITLLIDCEAHVTHNGTRFDLKFIESAMHRLREEKDEFYDGFLYEIDKKHIDTAALYKAEKIHSAKYWNESWPSFFSRVLEESTPGLKYNLGICCDDLGINRDNVQQHRALGDVYLTQMLYKKLTTVDIANA